MQWEQTTVKSKRRRRSEKCTYSNKDHKKGEDKTEYRGLMMPEETVRARSRKFRLFLSFRARCCDSARRMLMIHQRGSSASQSLVAKDHQEHGQQGARQEFFTAVLCGEGAENISYRLVPLVRTSFPAQRWRKSKSAEVSSLH